MATSSHQTLFSVYYTAPQLGISHQTLRNRIKSEEVVPTAWLNGRQAVFSREDIQRLKQTNGNGKKG